MGEPRSSTCEPWANEADLCSPCDDYDIDMGLMDDALQAASDILFALSGRQYPGKCTTTVTVDRRHIAAQSPGDPSLLRSVGAYTGRQSGRLGLRRTGAPKEITLGVHPVIDVTKVVVDGDELADSLYRVDDWRWLVREDDPDGSNPGWSFDDVMTVDVTYGRTPPPFGVQAAASLGCQLYLACQPEDVRDGCVLPKRIQSITRQGMQMVVMDPFDFLDEGKTGVYEVDLFLKQANPGGVARRAAIASPDVPSRVRRRDT